MGKKSNTAAKKPLGRPSGFSDKLALRILDLAEKGQTDVEIAKAIGVSASTFSNWKASRPDFLEALKNSKNIADQLVVASLFQRAVGYSHPAVKFIATRDGIEALDYVEHYPPDTTACIFWLKNRQPNRWRDRHELTGNDGQPVTVRLAYDPNKKGSTNGTTTEG